MFYANSERPTRDSGGSVKTLLRSLPGRAVSAVAWANGTLWFIIDPEKVGEHGTQVTQLLGLM